MGARLAGKMAGAQAGVRTLASTHAARGEATMKSGAKWVDQTGFARASLYGRAEGTTIYLGTTNEDYGLFLELGTIHMAARPIIEPTVNEVAQAYFRDASALIGAMLNG